MHNDNEEEKGEGRSASCPHERLKFQNFLTVAALLSLDLDDVSQCIQCTNTVHKYNSERFYDTDRWPRSSSK